MADVPLQLIVGLGNPGPQYAQTRHNAGFWLVDRLARDYAGQLRADSKFRGELGKITVDARPLWLLKPLTFMNRSGQAVAPLVNFYKIPLPAVLIVHDELDLPPGTLRLKRGGGHGGHNGLRDAIRWLGGSDFMRLRIGIGHPGVKTEVVNYALRRAPPEEQRLLNEAVDDAAAEFPRIAAGELDKAMTVLHSRKPAAPDPQPD